MLPTCPVSKPQIVHVVSMLEVPIRFGSTSFQSKLVRGAQKSEFLFCSVKTLIITIYRCSKQSLHCLKGIPAWYQVLLLSKYVNNHHWLQEGQGKLLSV